ncbi:MAG: hypothetical protein HN742_06175 [Lentisphaerae bacterium]|mgnify:CR=1 FL=1|jgi:hypothetical protein|nr:hypothetical protein [Lentisphaerota bacterium]MBT4821903.1 hypothetical protein [Lentisphaerota bacterium]MBT5609992.1 hypothetical protein [Lentisphaerota bacterium]MBT7059115.1 hypothetical protein [Lentisphaerota bacterium]MBT7841437.1 hypothetical protein [Lentisphaerota bacterium]
MQLKNVTLEISLKPFRDPSEPAVRAVCRHLFEQWQPLCLHADVISVLLWAADGSEILEYQGDLDAQFEWASTIGVANPRREPPPPEDPNSKSIHNHPYLYMDAPPTFTYGWLRTLVSALKETGREITGKPIKVGETFDPGPEFAKSSFKYERHPELCLGKTMGPGSMVCCYARLHADPDSYAGFPDGIEEGTPFGAFLGRQCQTFFADMGFDYLWLSNGFGFGLETWGLRGAVFDGETFSFERCPEVRDANLEFWKSFRAECPDLPLETRGTNLSTGMDLSSDGVPLREIYTGGFGLEPPPNSPWAALNSDFGLELVGWMSHIAEIPGETFPFRFYTHDPWFLNSPWLDRYEREPHDIYLPLSVCRLDAEGKPRTPTSFLFLTADDSYGKMPDQVPNEVIPHLLTARRDEPDQPGPLVWVYPFDEYHNWTFEEPTRIEEVFFGDWFMRGAMNNGLPLNTVISTRNFVSARAAATDTFAESIVVTPVPEAGGAWEEALLEHVASGGKALLYGPIAQAGPELLDALNLSCAPALADALELSLELEPDLFASVPMAQDLLHPELLSAGGMHAVIANDDDDTRILATASRGAQSRVAALCRSRPGWQGGTVVWVRGTVACNPEQTSGHLLIPFNPTVHFAGEVLMRYALQSFGLHITVEKDSAAQGSPVLTVARHANGFFLSGFTRDTTTALRLRFPQGAPLLVGLETRLTGGQSRYAMPRAWHRECRVFVEQETEGVLACHTVRSGMVGVERRLGVSGLDSATIRFYPEPGTEARVTMIRNGHHPFLSGEAVNTVIRNDGYGHYMQADSVTGDVMISW